MPIPLKFCAKGLLVNIKILKIINLDFKFIKNFYFLEEFVQFFKYVRELQFEEKPDYQFIKDLFKKLLIKNEWYNDFNFDWLSRPKEEAVSSSNFGMELNFFTKLNTVDENKNAMKIVSRRGSGLGDVLNVAKRLSGVTLKDEK